MDSYVGPAGLEWWANSVTCLAAFPIDLTASSGDHGWDVHATLVDPADQEGLDFFCDLDPLFALCINEDRTLDVMVAQDDSGVLSLTQSPA